jgi:hypothetical protein
VFFIVEVACLQVNLFLVEYKPFRSEDLITSGSLAQDLGFTAVLDKQAHSRLRNCFSGAVVKLKGKSKSGSY